MSRRITLVSQKGGVGKTTVALNLALALAERGRRTLLVDLDPQGGIGHALSRGDTELVGLADLLMGQIQPEEAILPTKVPRLSLFPRGRLDPADACDFELALASNGVLDSTLAKVERGFDITILDNPSGLGLITRAALMLADFALIPFQAQPLALRSTSQVLRVIDRVRSGENPKLQLLGILPTMVERDNDASHAVMMDIWSSFEAVTDTTIPRANVFADASLRGLPVGFLSGPVSPEARRFEVLASEVESLMDQLTPMEKQDVVRPERALL
ncbi:MAG: ParA family protein [Polyangiaceae bacterium]